MKQYFMSAIVALIGPLLSAAVPAIDVEQIKSDAAAAVAYASLARETPLPTPPAPTPAKENEPKSAKDAKEEALATAPPSEPLLPLLPSVQPAAAVPTRPTFAPQRAPAVYYYYTAPLPCPSGNCGSRFRWGR